MNKLMKTSALAAAVMLALPGTAFCYAQLPDIPEISGPALPIVPAKIEPAQVKLETAKPDQQPPQPEEIVPFESAEQPAQLLRPQPPALAAPNPAVLSPQAPAAGPRPDAALHNRKVVVYQREQQLNELIAKAPLPYEAEPQPEPDDVAADAETALLPESASAPEQLAAQAAAPSLQVTFHDVPAAMQGEILERCKELLAGYEPALNTYYTQRLAAMLRAEHDLPAASVQLTPGEPLQILVAAGRLGKIKVDNRSSLSNEAAAAYFESLLQGMALVGSELNAALVRLQERGYKVRAQFVPSLLEECADLQVVIEDLPAKEINRASFGLVRQGAHSLGDYRLQADFAVHNLSAHSDTLSGLAWYGLNGGHKGGAGLSHRWTFFAGRLQPELKLFYDSYAAGAGQDRNGLTGSIYGGELSLHSAAVRSLSTEFDLNAGVRLAYSQLDALVKRGSTWQEDDFNSRNAALFFGFTGKQELNSAFTLSYGLQAEGGQWSSYYDDYLTARGYADTSFAYTDSWTLNFKNSAWVSSAALHPYLQLDPQRYNAIFGGGDFLSDQTWSSEINAAYQNSSFSLVPYIQYSYLQSKALDESVNAAAGGLRLGWNYAGWDVGANLAAKLWSSELAEDLDAVNDYAVYFNFGYTY